MAEDEEIALLYAWRAGDRLAGDRLMRQYYSRVLGFFRLRAAIAADDLTQRTFLACTESKERLRTTSFRAFLFGVARKMLLKHIEAESRKAHHMNEFEMGRPQSILSPSGVIAQRREHWLLLRALDRLPDEMQTVVALFYVEGLRAREIAEVLDVPTSTITTRLSGPGTRCGPRSRPCARRPRCGALCSRTSICGPGRWEHSYSR